MPKQIVIEATAVNYGDDRGGVHQDIGDLIDPPKDTARALALAGRTLYVDRKDDPDKHGRYTASDDLVKAAKAATKGRDKAEVKADA